VTSKVTWRVREEKRLLLEIIGKKGGKSGGEEKGEPRGAILQQRNRMQRDSGHFKGRLSAAGVPKVDEEKKRR